MSASRGALVLERLLIDPVFRAEFRRAPAATLERWGLDDVARSLGRVERLDARESRSSLAGVLMAAAVEGLGLLAREHADAALEPEARAAWHGALERPAIKRLTASIPLRTGALAAVPHHHVVQHAHELVADAVSGGPVVPYPGDDASKEAIAAWMGAAAKRAGLPPELPVMAALQESSLRNLAGGDADSVGFFQMRVSVWNTGEYAGYAHQPDLQLRWFIDHALAEKARTPQLAASPHSYGEWIANVERPAAQYRGLYAGHLNEARRLLAAAPDSPPRHAAHAAAAARTAMAPASRSRTGVQRAAGHAADAFDANGRAPLGRRMLGIAAHELGQHEDPPGSNNSARIAAYRTATPGGPVGPWCAYFVSWVAAKAGMPLGDHGQGFASVDALWAWAEHSGHAVSASSTPRPGDLIVWDEHVGLVERVDPDGTIHTIEGNTTDQVARRVHSAAGVVGFVRLGR